jgi:hypothetical protein
VAAPESSRTAESCVYECGTWGMPRFKEEDQMFGRDAVMEGLSTNCLRFIVDLYRGVGSEGSMFMGWSLK